MRAVLYKVVSLRWFKIPVTVTVCAKLYVTKGNLDISRPTIVWTSNLKENFLIREVLHYVDSCATCDVAKKILRKVKQIFSHTLKVFL